MSKLSEITDDEFVPFLHNLGVETYKKSFEWMLNDPSFAGVFKWLYNNLDHNNSLSAREEYRYAELQKIDKLLPAEDLESTVLSIQNDFPGICLPGDEDGLEDIKRDITMQKEKLHALEQQENVLKELIDHNKTIKETLKIKMSKLNSAQMQYVDEENAAVAECLTLAEEVETLTEEVVDVIADALDMYGNCHVDKDIAKKFLTFGPLDQYRQSQALFRSHFDLYTARKFCKKQNDSSYSEDLRTALAEARNLEERLSDAAFDYIESKADLCAEQEKLDLVQNYNGVHPSQITSLSLEAHSALELLTQEEDILEQQVEAAVEQMVSQRTQLAVDSATHAALVVREQIHSDLSHLLEISHQALLLDRLLYQLLRHELSTAEDLAQFASQLRQYLNCETQNICARIESMSEITSAQESAVLKLKSSDLLVQTLSSILGCDSDDVTVLAKMYTDLRNRVRKLREDVHEGYRRKEEDLDQFTASLSPLRQCVFSGSTRHPARECREVTSLTRTLTQRLQRAERSITELGTQFTAVKTGDMHNMRKLWQWFLTDILRLMTAVKRLPGSYT